MLDVVSEIARFNAGRDPERLAMKYRLMRGSALSFLRGTCHLFYARLKKGGVLDEAPPVWISGDLHIENFGSYKGDNGLVYFDLNDFDEACLAPSLVELVRLLASVIVAGDTLGLAHADALALCRVAVDAYADALAAGKARWVEAELADGMVRELFDGLSGRKRVELLDRRTERVGTKRRLKLDGKKALPVDEAARAAVTAFMAAFASKQDDPAFYQMIDVARRIAGTGSLGVDRYVVLVEGKGSPDGNYLLDLKAALPSSVAPHVDVAQPAWKSEAERVVAVQYRAQVVSQAFLRAVELGGRPYVLRSLQPSEDRVDLSAWGGKLGRLETVVATMGRLSAWAQLRSSGRDGSAIADTLIAFGARRDWRGPIVELAAASAAQVDADWHTYCTGYDHGAFALAAL